MNLKNIFILLFLFTISTVSFAQFFPQSYFMPGDSRIAKTAANPAISSSNVSDILTIGDTIWIGTGQGLSLSTDNGNSWKNFTNDKTFGTLSISAIGYNNGVFWAAAATDTNTSQGSMPKGRGLRYTTDNGQNWTFVPEPVDNLKDTIVNYGNNKLVANPIPISINNLVYDMAFTPGTIWIATFAGGLRKSTDMGKTWQRVVLPPDYLDAIKPSDTLHFCMQPTSSKTCAENNLNYRVFSVIATNDSTLYVGTADGINKSTDNGISWRKFTHSNENNPVSGNFVVALGYNKYNNTVWGATWQAEGSSEFYAVSYTTDGGANWQTSLDGDHVHNFAFKDNQVIAPADEGAFRSSDNGANWVLPTSITDANTGITLQSNTFYAAAFNGNYVWLGSDEGLARLNETGSSIWNGTWTLYFASSPLSSSTSTYAYPNPFNPNTDILKIKYSTGGKSEPVTIRIFNFSMHYIRTIIQNAQRGTIHSVDQSGGVIDYWNGLDAAGNLVPNGVYFYSVKVGSGKAEFGKILVIH